MNIWSENDIFDVFLMRYVDGLTYKKVSEKYNISQERIRQVTLKAKWILRRKYNIEIPMLDNGEY